MLSRSLALIFPVLMVASCSPSDEGDYATTARTPHISSAIETSGRSEVTDVDGTGPYTSYVISHDRQIVPVRYLEVVGLAVVGGDMILGTHAEMQRRVEILGSLGGVSQSSSDNAVTGPGKRLGVKQKALLAPTGHQALVRMLGWGTMDPLWPHKTIPFRIDSSIPASDPRRARITDAVALWNDQSVIALRPAEHVSGSELQGKTVLTFVDHPARDDRFACMSPVGYHPVDGSQSLYVNPTCDKGNIAHELGHALGLHHEHQRNDRGTFLHVAKQAPSDAQYGPLPGRHLNSHDLCSIMHYDASLTEPPWFVVSEAGRQAHKACLAKMSAGSECRQVGQRCQLSSSDREAIAVLYR